MTALPLAFAAWIPVIVALGILGFLMWRMSTRNTAAKVQEAYHTPPPRLGPKRDPLDEPADFLEFEVKMHEISQEVLAKLDTKMSALMTLTRQAQEKIERLEELLAAAGQLPLGEKPSAARLSAPAGETSPIDPRHAAVYELADQGFSATTIAHRTSRPLAEIERLLAERAAGNA